MFLKTKVFVVKNNSAALQIVIPFQLSVHFQSGKRRNFTGSTQDRGRPHGGVEHLHVGAELVEFVETLAWNKKISLESSWLRECSLTSRPVANVIKLFTAVSYDFS
jgi:hypothetical protein